MFLSLIKISVIYIFYNRIDLGGGTNVTDGNNSKECVLYHYWYFNHGFKFRNSVFHSRHDFEMWCLNLSSIVSITDFSLLFLLLLFMTSTELLQFIFQNILCLMILGIYKNHIKEINIKIRFCNYCFDNLIKGKNYNYFHQLEKL